jgi:hypothetical protein
VPEMNVIEQGNKLDFSHKNAGLAGNIASTIRHPMDCSKTLADTWQPNQPYKLPNLTDTYKTY